MNEYKTFMKGNEYIIHYYNERLAFWQFYFIDFNIPILTWFTEIMI